jgi:hypothetical protein
MYEWDFAEDKFAMNLVLFFAISQLPKMLQLDFSGSYFIRVSQLNTRTRSVGSKFACRV